MTRQTTEALIAEARDVLSRTIRADHESEEARGVILALSDRLEAVAEESSTGQHQHAYWQKRAEDAESDRADLIDAAKATYDVLRNSRYVRKDRVAIRILRSYVEEPRND